MTPIATLDSAIEYYKLSGQDYDDLDLDEQQRICGLYGEAHPEILDDMLCDINNKDLPKYLREGERLELGEFVATKIQDYMEHWVIDYYRSLYVRRGPCPDEAGDRMRDREEAA